MDTRLFPTHATGWHRATTWRTIPPARFAQQRRHPGFTLIEVMISIAILAILAAVPLSIKGTVQWLNHEEDYRFALRNARHQVEALRTLPCATLPPRLVRVPPDGTLDLGQEGIVTESINVRNLEGGAVEAPVTFDPVRSTLRTAPVLAGRDLIVDYRFATPDAPEAVSVSSAAPCTARLHNAPATRVTSVKLLQGASQQAVPPAICRLDPSSGLLSLPAQTAGRAVLVEYVGTRIRNEVSGTFLDTDLHPTRARGPFKLMRVEERYGDDQVRLRLSVLRAMP